MNKHAVTEAARNRAARQTRFCLLLATMLASCAKPSADYYVGGATPGTSLGADTAGEICTLQGGDIFCGSFTQPSGHVAPGGPANAATLAALAASGSWRAGIDQRLACQEPQSTTILGDVPALLLSCTRKIGGWPQVALAASATAPPMSATPSCPSCRHWNARSACSRAGSPPAAPHRCRPPPPMR
jgi:hypothetical protein